MIEIICSSIAEAIREELAYRAGVPLTRLPTHPDTRRRERRRLADLPSPLSV